MTKGSIGGSRSIKRKLQCSVDDGTFFESVSDTENDACLQSTTGRLIRTKVQIYPNSGLHSKVTG